MVFWDHKHLKNILQGFCKRKGAGGVGGLKEGCRDFVLVIKYLRHISESFCKGWWRRVRGMMQRY